MMYQGYVRTGQYWWLLSPNYFSSLSACGRIVSTSGGYSNASVNAVDGLRPVIFLNPGVEISSGDGTYNSPYIIDTSGN